MKGPKVYDYLNTSMKTCNHCKTIKEDTEFNKNQSRCRVCSKAYYAAAKLKPGFAENRRVKSQEGYYRDVDATRKRLAKHATGYRKKLREEFLAEYGGRCECCGISEPAFLSLEHKNKDGAAHRRSKWGNNRGNSHELLRDIKKQGWPKDIYGILCHNCNRASFYGICPHKEARTHHSGI